MVCRRWCLLRTYAAGSVCSLFWCVCVWKYWSRGSAERIWGELFFWGLAKFQKIAIKFLSEFVSEFFSRFFGLASPGLRPPEKFTLRHAI